MNLACAGFMPSRGVGELHVGIAAKEARGVAAEIALAHVAMIEVELQSDIGVTDAIENA